MAILTINDLDYKDCEAIAANIRANQKSYRGAIIVSLSRLSELHMNYAEAYTRAWLMLSFGFSHVGSNYE